MHRSVLTLAPLSLVLACSQPAPAGAPAPRRVIVEFTQARQLADARALAELSQASGLRVEYASAISTRSAAYRLHCNTADPQCTEALERLSRHAGVAHAEFDHKLGHRTDRQEKLP